MWTDIRALWTALSCCPAEFCGLFVDGVVVFVDLADGCFPVFFTVDARQHLGGQLVGRAVVDDATQFQSTMRCENICASSTS